MGRIGAGELIIILAITLIIFGPSKLPELGKSMGQAFGQFKAQANKMTEDIGSSEDKKA